MNTDWKEMTLGEILHLEYGKPLSESDRKENGRFPVYGANGEKDRTDRFYYDKPSIIVGRKGSAGAINLTEEKFWPLDVTYFVTFDAEKHDLRFLYYLLMTLDIPKLAKGVKPGINRDEVYSRVAKAPLLAEQQRIASILDEAFDGIAIAKANAEKNLQLVRELFNVVVSSACLGKLTEGWRNAHPELPCTANSTAILRKRRLRWEEDQIASYKSKAVQPPKDWQEKYKTPAEPDTSTLPILPGGWKTLSVSQATHRLTYGITVRPKYVENGIPIISGREIRSGEIDLDIAKRVSQRDFNGLRKNCKLQLNDVLFGKTGTIGTVARVKVDFPLCVSQNVALLSPLIDPEYLELVLRSPVIQQMARKAILDAAIPDLQLRFLERFPIPLPPEEEQRAIVAKVDAIKEESQRLEFIYQRKLAALEELKRSLLNEAFTGKL